MVSKPAKTALTYELNLQTCLGQSWFLVCRSDTAPGRALDVLSCFRWAWYLLQNHLHIERSNQVSPLLWYVRWAQAWPVSLCLLSCFHWYGWWIQSRPITYTTQPVHYHCHTCKTFAYQPFQSYKQDRQWHYSSSIALHSYSSTGIRSSGLSQWLGSKVPWLCVSPNRTKSWKRT